MSSDEEMFQECESGFDLDTTAKNSGPTSVQAHSSNIDDHNVFDRTINFSTIAANSTAGLVTSTTTDLWQLNENSDILFKTSETDQTMIVNQTFEPPLNQTIEMAECDPIDGIALQNNVTADVPKENAEQSSPVNEMQSPVEIDTQPEKCELQNQTLPMNVTQDLNDMPTTTVESNQTIDLSHSYENNATLPIEVQNDSLAVSDIAINNSNNGDAPPINATFDGSEEIVELSAHANEVRSPVEVVIQPENCELKNQTLPMNVTQDLNDMPTTTVELNQTITNSMEIIVTSPVELSSANDTFAKNDSDEVTSSMNVTVDEPMESVELYSSINGKASPVEVGIQPEICELLNRTIPMNVTQDLNDMPTNAVVFNQTIDLSNSMGMNVASPVQLNGTFAKNDSPAAFNVTHNVSKDLLSSTRRSIDAISQNATPSNGINLNETIVVDNKLPCMNTSFIVPPPKPVEMQQKPNDVNKEVRATPNHDPFKLPAVPSNASNPFDSKLKTQTFDISDDEFQSPGCKFLFSFCFYDLRFSFIEFRFEFSVQFSLILMLDLIVVFCFEMDFMLVNIMHDCNWVPDRKLNYITFQFVLCVTIGYLNALFQCFSEVFQYVSEDWKNRKIGKSSRKLMDCNFIELQFLINFNTTIRLS